MPETLDLLSRRRSVPQPALVDPAPEGAVLEQILTIASRVPDHGKLAPWRFILIDRAGGEALAPVIEAAAKAADPAISAERLAQDRARLASPLVVAVVSKAGAHPKIPEWEQVLSAGAVCMNLVTAATAAGFGAVWLTGWVAYEPSILKALGLAEGERIAGFVHMGTATMTPPDRPRPPLDEIVTRWRPA